MNKPLKSASTTNRDDRIELGNEKQCELFGEHMRGFQTSGPEEERHIKRWLAGNCFGDNYTRMGLTGAQREMITFCFILAQGGCENQLRGHTAGNFNVGNGRFLDNLGDGIINKIHNLRSGKIKNVLMS